MVGDDAPLVPHDEMPPPPRLFHKCLASTMAMRRGGKSPDDRTAFLPQSGPAPEFHQQREENPTEAAGMQASQIVLDRPGAAAAWAASVFPRGNLAMAQRVASRGTRKEQPNVVLSDGQHQQNPWCVARLGHFMMLQKRTPGSRHNTCTRYAAHADMFQRCLKADADFDLQIGTTTHFVAPPPKFIRSARVRFRAASSSTSGAFHDARP